MMKYCFKKKKTYGEPAGFPEKCYLRTVCFLLLTGMFMMLFRFSAGTSYAGEIQPDLTGNVIFPEEETVDGYDPTVVPNQQTAAKRKMFKAAGGGTAGWIADFTDFRDQLEGLSLSVYDRMAETYITKESKGDLTAADNENVSVPAFQIKISLDYSASAGYLFPGKVVTNAAGKKTVSVDKDTQEFQDAYAEITYLVQSAVDAFAYDHPEVFWYRPDGYILSYGGDSSTIVTDPESGEQSVTAYLAGIKMLMKEPFPGAYDLKDDFRTSLQAVSAGLRNTSACDFDEDGSVSDQEYIQAAHDYIIERMYYDRTALSNYETTGDYRIFTAAGAFLDSVGTGVVCEGYSKAFKILLNAGSVPCCLIAGTLSGGEGHMWNALRLGSDWYLADVTLDDKGGRPDSDSFYKYYLVSSIANRTASGRFSKTNVSAKSFSYPEIVILNAHVFSETENGNAECTSYRKYACAEDGICYWLSPYGHDMEENEGSEPSCINDGVLHYYRCSRCGKLFSDSDGKTEIKDAAGTVLEKTGHSMKEIPAKAAACTAEGNIRYYRCSRCRKLFSDAAGKNELKGTEETVLAKLGHTLTKIPAKAATCTAEGNIRYYRCSRCQKLFSDAAGENELKGTKETVLAKLGHAMTEIPAKAATCTAGGNIRYYRCSRCGRLYSDSSGASELKAEAAVLNALGHRWDGGAVTKDPTVSSEGEITYTCLNDSSHRKTNTIAKLTERQAEGDPSDPMTVAWARKIITGKKSAGELEGASFSKLLLRSGKQWKKSILLNWKKVQGADGYILFGSRYGAAYPMKQIAKFGKTRDSCVRKNLRTGVYYKYTLVAYKTVKGIQRVVGCSRRIFVSTRGGKVTNPSSVAVSPKKFSVLSGKSTRISVNTVKQEQKLRLKIIRDISYESSNTKIATVNKNGKIKGRSPGSCYIYVYSQSGVYARVKVTVKKADG